MGTSESSAALDDDNHVFRSAMEESAESSNVEPPLCDATRAQFQNLVSAIKTWILFGSWANAQEEDRDD